MNGSRSRIVAAEPHAAVLKATTNKLLSAYSLLMSSRHSGHCVTWTSSNFEQYGHSTNGVMFSVAIVPCYADAKPEIKGNLPDLFAVVLYI